MAAAQPGYEYAGYEYAYGSSTAAGYPQYAGYEANGTYTASTGYDGYSAPGQYSANPSTGPSYSTVDPYSGYAATTYAYPAPSTATGAPPSAAVSTATYPSPYNTASAGAGYAYDTRRPVSPPSAATTSLPPSAHYSSYEYSAASASSTGTYSVANPAGTAYPPYKTAAPPNGAPSNSYPSYPPGAAPAHAPYGVPPTSHLSGGSAVPSSAPPHLYGTQPAGGSIVSRRPDYYPSASVAQPMQYVQHQSSAMPYRLPPRGGYQRELDEPGDENALLRHVVYITGLPKEIQNETLAEVFGAACGPIAPVDVRSPKPKIWVYKDRQTREGKGEATITFINPDSAQMAISYFNGKELFGREVRVTLCPRRMYNMQKQNTPFNPGAAPSNTSTPISAITKPNNTNISISTNNSSSNTGNLTTSTTGASTPTPSTTTTTATPIGTSSTSTTTTNNTTTTTASSSTTTPTTTATTNSSTQANPIATISSSTLGLPRQYNHSLFKIRQTPEQQRGLLPTPPISIGGHLMGNTLHRDGVRKELPRIGLTRGNYANPAGVRPKPY